MFERFTERARQVVVLAQEEARHFNHTFIGTEHILLGLLREEEGLAARVLKSYITDNEVREDIIRIIGMGEEEVTIQQIPFTPRAKKVLELSLREALSLGHNYIGTEHILLALSRDTDGLAKRIMLDHNLNGEFVRDSVIAMLSGPGSRKAKKEQMAKERKKREAKAREQWQETQHKTEEETLKSDGQNESEPNSQKAQGIFTYGDWTLQIEEDTSGQPSIQIKSPFGSLSATFKR